MKELPGDAERGPFRILGRIHFDASGVRSRFLGFFALFGMGPGVIQAALSAEVGSFENGEHSRSR